MNDDPQMVFDLVCALDSRLCGFGDDDPIAA
jgi:hypothetical protein